MVIRATQILAGCRAMVVTTEPLLQTWSGLKNLTPGPPTLQASSLPIKPALLTGKITSILHLN